MYSTFPDTQGIHTRSTTTWLCVGDTYPSVQAFVQITLHVSQVANCLTECYKSS